MAFRKRISPVAGILAFMLVSAGLSLLMGLVNAPSAFAWCDSDQASGLCSCGVSMPPPHTGPNGGSCDPICLGPGYPGCGCYGGTWVGDCGGSGPPPGPPPPPPCVPLVCAAFPCGGSNPCSNCPVVAGDGVCCPPEQKGQPGYNCGDCTACGNRLHDGLNIGCFCSDANCPVGGRP